MGLVANFETRRNGKKYRQANEEKGKIQQNAQPLVDNIFRLADVTNANVV